MSIRNMLDLSTAHMPGPKPYFTNLRVVEHEYGFVVFVADGWLKTGDALGPARWLVPIMEKAVKHDCMVIVFDRDAGTDDDLKTYDW